MRAGTELSLEGASTSGKILKNHNFFHYITGTLVTGGLWSPLGKGLGGAVGMGGYALLLSGVTWWLFPRGQACPGWLRGNR